MPNAGPGKRGGSRATIRKREQRKRKMARESAKPVRKQAVKTTTTTRPVLDSSEKDIEDRLAMMAYEIVTLATQIRKSLNNYGCQIEAIAPDLKRAEGVIRGALKENAARDRKE